MSILTYQALAAIDRANGFKPQRTTQARKVLAKVNGEGFYTDGAITSSKAPAKGQAIKVRTLGMVGAPIGERVAAHRHWRECGCPPHPVFSPEAWKTLRVDSATNLVRPRVRVCSRCKLEVCKCRNIQHAPECERRLSLLAGCGRIAACTCGEAAEILTAEREACYQ